MTAFEIQVAADRKHHAERIDWLTAPNPTWSCGTPVNKSDIESMLRVSRECLSDSSGMVGLNSSTT